MASDKSQTTKWQPMETAPRDGTDFLARIPFKKKHHQMVGSYAPNGCFVSWPGRWPYKPDGWMQLPLPECEGIAA